MANNPIGPLLAADESLTHQVADTFAIVGTSDPAWTEKICAMAMARDGSLQIGFGLGRYPNRNVLDAYAAASRGAEQLTVRGSRSLSADPESTSVGPIRYEVVEPLQKVRFTLEAPRIARHAAITIRELAPSDESLESVFEYLVAGVRGGAGGES